MFEKLQKIASCFGLNLSQSNKWYFLKNRKGKLLTKTHSLNVITDDLKGRSWNNELEKVK